MTTAGPGSQPIAAAPSCAWPSGRPCCRCCSSCSRRPPPCHPRCSRCPWSRSCSVRGWRSRPRCGTARTAGSRCRRWAWRCAPASTSRRSRGRRWRRSSPSPSAPASGSWSTPRVPAIAQLRPSHGTSRCAGWRSASSRRHIGTCDPALPRTRRVSTPPEPNPCRLHRQGSVRRSLLGRWESSASETTKLAEPGPAKFHPTSRGHDCRIRTARSERSDRGPSRRMERA